MVGSSVGKLIFILTTFFVSLPLWANRFAQNLIFEDTSIAKSPAWQTMLREDFMKQPVGMMVGRLPESYQQMIKDGFDIPIQRLTQLHEASRLYWSETTSEQNLDPGNFLKMAKIDLLTLKDLNLLSAEVWDQIVKCNNESPELARLKIFEMGQFCEESGLEKITSDKFYELSQNFQSFLLASPVMSRKTNPVFDGSFVKFVNVHPLLVQLAIVQWSIFLNHAAEKKAAISEALTLAAMKIEYNQSIRENPSFNSDPAFFKSLMEVENPGEIAIYKLSSNSIAFLSFLSASKVNVNPCEIYGLWPAVNRTLLYRMMLWGSTEFSLFEQINRAEEKVIQNCGRKVHIIGDPQMSRTIYSPAGLLHLQNMKSLFHHWLGQFWKIK